MRRIRSFIAAIVLIAILMGCVHVACSGMSLKVDNGWFQFWYSPYKDLSYKALSDNIRENTVLLMGSSEFAFGRRTITHPRNMLAGNGFDLLAIGGAGNQTLFHAIALGALEDRLKERKVVLLVSPTWFRKEGVSEMHYGMRFSEMEYIRFLQNKKLDTHTKHYVAKRSQTLLDSNSKLKNKVRLINDSLAYGNAGLLTKLRFAIEREFAADRDVAPSAVALKQIIDKPPRKTRKGRLDPELIAKLEKKALKNSAKHSDNPFDMKNNNWKKKYKGIYMYMKGAFPGRISPVSKEFGDLKAFLEVCRQTRVKAKLIIIPVNGKWYDYTGTSGIARQKTTEKIVGLAKKYGAEAADLTKYEYEPYITRDVVHPWKRGWVLINKEIYNFCKKV